MFNVVDVFMTKFMSKFKRMCAAGTMIENDNVFIVKLSNLTIISEPKILRLTMFDTVLEIKQKKSKWVPMVYRDIVAFKYGICSPLFNVYGNKVINTPLTMEYTKKQNAAAAMLNAMLFY